MASSCHFVSLRLKSRFWHWSVLHTKFLLRVLCEVFNKQEVSQIVCMKCERNSVLLNYFVHNRYGIHVALADPEGGQEGAWPLNVRRIFWFCKNRFHDKLAISSDYDNAKRCSALRGASPPDPSGDSAFTLLHQTLALDPPVIRRY